MSILIHHLSLVAQSQVLKISIIHIKVLITYIHRNLILHNTIPLKKTGVWLAQRMYLLVSFNQTCPYQFHHIAIILWTIYTKWNILEQTICIDFAEKTTKRPISLIPHTTFRLGIDARILKQNMKITENKNKVVKNRVSLQQEQVRFRKFKFYNNMTSSNASTPIHPDPDKGIGHEETRNEEVGLKFKILPAQFRLGVAICIQ